MWHRLQKGIGVIIQQGSSLAGRGLRTLSPEEQTEASWAKAIRRYQEVPDIYKSFFHPILTGGQEFPYTVLTPTYKGFIHGGTEKLVCYFDRAIHVLERKDRAVDIQRFLLDKISRLEVQTILLDSSIRIHGVSENGLKISSSWRFNTVTDHLFKPVLQVIRLGVHDPDKVTQRSETEIFDAWGMRNLKFMNYAKRSLLAGDLVLHKILQPELQEPVFRIFGKTYKRFISPCQAMILTNRELIVIQEVKKRRSTSKYGGIWTYIPRNKIKNFSLMRSENNLLITGVHLIDDTHLEYPFNASTKNEIEQMQAELGGTPSATVT